MRIFRVCLILISLSLLVIALFVFNSLRSTTLHGPRSNIGYSVEVKVSDMQWGPGADYYCDVYVHDSDGKQVSMWKDSKGQKSMDNARMLLSSMIWKNGNILAFTTSDGLIEINVGEKSKLKGAPCKGKERTYLGKDRE